MTITRANVPDGMELTKFHRIFGALGVALEVSFSSAEDIEIDPELSSFPQAIYKSPEGARVRIYYPAIRAGSVEFGDELILDFYPSVDEEKYEQFHRVVFRKKDAGEVFVFCRFPHEMKPGEAPFGFSINKPFINLDFLGKRSGEFLPLFVKTHDRGQSGYVYLQITARSDDAGVSLMIERVDEKVVPPLLVLKNLVW